MLTKQIVFKFEIKETYILLLEQEAIMEATKKKMIQTMMMQVILKRKVKRKMILSEIIAILLM